MTLARNSLRCRAYASSDSRLSRVIMPLFYESGLDLREGERHLAARRHRHAQLAGDLRDREDAAHHRALHHQRMLAAGEIGRASCRERGESSGVAVGLKKDREGEDEW